MPASLDPSTTTTAEHGAPAPGTQALPEEAVPVLAHLMLGSLSAITMAATTLSERHRQLDQATVEQLLGILTRQSTKLRDSVSELAAGRGFEALALLAEHLRGLE